MEITQIQLLTNENKIKWSTHAAIRIQERGISRRDVINCLTNGEIIEQYPSDYPFPSCLVFGYSLNQNIMHVVVGTEEDFLCAFIVNVKN